MTFDLKHSLNLQNYIDTPRLLSPEDFVSKRVLVAVDGSIFSIHALEHANHLFDVPNAMIYVVHVIEWTDEDEESFDSELTKRMELEGRRLLTRLLVSKKIHCERIVKIGDPAAKIAETASRLDVDIIFLGSKGLGGTSEDMGRVTKKVISLTSKPIILVN
jgi:nucleotide-binding universal stress UspA family protein